MAIMYIRMIPTQPSKKEIARKCGNGLHRSFLGRAAVYTQLMCSIFYPSHFFPQWSFCALSSSLFFSAVAHIHFLAVKAGCWGHVCRWFRGMLEERRWQREVETSFWWPKGAFWFSWGYLTKSSPFTQTRATHQVKKHARPEVFRPNGSGPSLLNCTISPSFHVKPCLIQSEKRKKKKGIACCSLLIYTSLFSLPASYPSRQKRFCYHPALLIVTI